jgi:exopolysaccharide biosynthesis polyprenyl glycosylphosphotransferase
MTAAEETKSIPQDLFYQRAMNAVDTRTVEILERRRTTAIVRRRGWLVRRTLMLADVLGLAVAFLAVESLRGPASADLIPFLVVVAAWILGATVYGLYAQDEVRADHTTVDDLVSVFHLLTVGSWLFFAGAWLAGAAVDMSELVTFWASAIVLLTCTRSLARSWSRRQLTYLQNTVIVGAGDIGQLVARKLLQHPEYGINLVGFVDDTPKDRRADLGHLALVGPLERLPEIIYLFDVERVIVAFSNDSHEELVNMIRSLRNANIQVDIVPRLFELIGPSVCTHTVEGLPLIGLPPTKHGRVALGIKRTIDLIGAAIGLILTAPLLVLIAILIKWGSPGPIFFRQTRLGKNMKEFTVLKFRTMTVDADAGPHRDFIMSMNGSAVAPTESGLYKLDRTRDLTRVGHWLRKSSLDELPQLINVLRGEMALVGPRPCIPYEIEQFAPHHFERFTVPAGITGLWQVTARAHSTFREALDMDVTYARDWSVKLDLAVMLRTARQLVRTASTA